MDLVLSIMVLAAIALVIGAMVLLRRGGMGKQAALMLVLAGVMIANVLIWAVPYGDGEAPVDKAAAALAD